MNGAPSGAPFISCRGCSLRSQDDAGGDREPQQRPEPNKPQQRPPTPPAQPPPQMPRRSWLGFILVLLINYLAFRFIFPNTESAKIPYSDLQAAGDAGQRRAVLGRGDRVSGRFVRPIDFPAKPDSTAKAEPRKVTDFTTTIPAFADPGARVAARRARHRNQRRTGAGTARGSACCSGSRRRCSSSALYVWMFRRASKQGGMGGGIFGLGKEQRAAVRQGDRTRG